MINRTHIRNLGALLVMAAFGSCHPGNSKTAAEKAAPVRLVTLAPGHFHAALVQKSMYPGIDSVVHVYAPEGPELEAQLRLIQQYNGRSEQPTHWHEAVYRGNDFLEKMTAEKKGNVVVIAGNNRRKTAYIRQSVAAGMNVLADKPMAISAADFDTLLLAFEAAEKQKLLLYDIMTERSEITAILQRELAQQPALFGSLQQGSPGQPAVEMESVHHFYKYVSGNVLQRPAWFFDVAQQGDGITDVGTHLVDLVQWTCFPEKIIDYKKDIQVLAAKRWPAPLTLGQFSLITGQPSFPAFLQPYVQHDTLLQVPANGEIRYTINGVHARITALWRYQAPEASGDTHYALLRGTRASLVIKQGREEQYQPALYIQPAPQWAGSAAYRDSVRAVVQRLAKQYPGIGITPAANGWKLMIPDKYKVGHEAHFAQVMQRFLQYLQHGGLPRWEQPNMIAKYYTTTKALKMLKKA